MLHVSCFMLPVLCLSYSMIISVYKPVGITSHDVVRIYKQQYPGEKVGHGGALDPLAEGVLIIAIGREDTKKLHAILNNATKIYQAVIELGSISETDDAQGPIQPTPHMPSIEAITPETIHKILMSFQGTIEQIPPTYSAIKIKGKPAYKRVRAGEQLKLLPRQVIIHKIQLIDYIYPHLTLKVHTGAGVYIRSLARDIGNRLQTGAYLKKLIRQQVGPYTIDKCVILKNT